jgi:hypothetical protein
VDDGGAGCSTRLPSSEGRHERARPYEAPESRSPYRHGRRITKKHVRSSSALRGGGFRSRSDPSRARRVTRRHTVDVVSPRAGWLLLRRWRRPLFVAHRSRVERAPLQPQEPPARRAGWKWFASSRRSLLPPGNSSVETSRGVAPVPRSTEPVRSRSLRCVPILSNDVRLYDAMKVQVHRHGGGRSRPSTRPRAHWAFLMWLDRWIPCPPGSASWCGRREDLASRAVWPRASREAFT